MKYVYGFEKLQVWIESKELTKNIYKITQKFPENEKFGLISQLRRASISVCSNIAEGVSRNTHKDKARFMIIAFSSAVEVVNQLIISHELDFITQKQYQDLRKQLESITNKLNALRKYQISNQ
ncbi:four helix bundle protein [uncultured Kordia sp.]|uniref:four helix bundle protein n=1 Tax=uncultured Kordia sp. TaxID=507699 RepID=UPI002619A0E6|nr:four helix bundle protein [uncultured Kordia sp.]